MSHQVLKSLFRFLHADSLEPYFRVNSMKYVFKNDNNQKRNDYPANQADLSNIPQS